MNDDTSSGYNRKFPILSSKEALISLFRTINFIDNCLRCFEDNYDKKIVSYKENICELFKKIPTSLPPKNAMIIKENIKNIIAVGGKWYIDKMNARVSHIKIRRLVKK